MKNVHLIPTDKPSKLYYWEGKLRLGDLTTAPKNLGISNQNIYITSDEHPKPNDFYFDFQNQKVKKCETGYYNKGSKKIILTDNKDLIKDGVQAIDDEFLEWFVKNPSCEQVEVNESPITNDSKGYKSFYKIIFPKEEPNQVGIDWSGFPKSTQEKVGYVETKQETLEEAARNYAIKKRERKHLSNREFDLCQKDFIVGAKWQQERMYSEEEVFEMMSKCPYVLPTDIKNWIEQNLKRNKI